MKTYRHNRIVYSTEWKNDPICKIIVYHDSLPASSRGSHVKSDYAHAIIAISPYTRHMLLDSQQLRPNNSLPQPHQVKASHHFPGDNPSERGRAVQMNTGPSKNGSWKLNRRHMHQGSLFIALFPPLSFPCCPGPASRHPSNLTSVYPIPALHLLLPSTPF